MDAAGAETKPRLIPEFVRVIGKGALASFNLKDTLRFLNSTKRIETVSSLLLLNGFIFGGSLALWEWGVLPALDRVGTWMMSESQAPVQDIQMAKAAAIQFVTFLWLAPMLVLSMILNMVWYNEIAEDAFKKRNLRMKRVATKNLRDEVYRVMLFFVLTIQTWATLNFLPKYVGYPIEFVQSSWTIAFYCFDYRWSLTGLTLEERLKKFESNWVFMLGFGAPLAGLALWLPVFWGYVAYGLFFPVCMILAIETDPVLHRRGWPSVRVFRMSQYFTLWLIRAIAGFNQYRKHQ
jgi:etoposide-induced 2.4 mRNA